MKDKKIDKGFPEAWTPPTLTDEQRTLVEAWVQDLRKTRAKQARGHLWVPPAKAKAQGLRPGYCCLGRFCKVAGVMITPGQGMPDSRLSVKWLGGAFWKVPMGRYKGPFAESFAGLNDDCYLTFKEIAQVADWAYLDGPRPEFYQP